MAFIQDMLKQLKEILQAKLPEIQAATGARKVFLKLKLKKKNLDVYRKDKLVGGEELIAYLHVSEVSNVYFNDEQTKRYKVEGQHVFLKCDDFYAQHIKVETEAFCEAHDLAFLHMKGKPRRFFV